jgi:hypothetical protein
MKVQKMRILVTVFVFVLCFFGVAFAVETPYGGQNIDESRYPQIIRDWFN